MKGMSKDITTLPKWSQDLFNKCYTVWPAGRKQRGVCEQSWTKLNPNEELANDIYQRILAWNRYYRDNSVDLKYVRLFSTWLNQKGFKDDIPSHTEETEETKNHVCVGQNCTNKAPRKFMLCEKCQKKYESAPDQKFGWDAQSRKQWFIDNGLYVENDTKTQFMKRCAKFRDEAIGRLKLR